MIRLPLWLTGESPCSYLSQRSSRSLVVDPTLAMDSSLYTQLLNQGFRRSGNQVYRPHCDDCQACIATRLAVAEFVPDRRQRRCWQRNRHTQVVVKSTQFDPRHFELYRRYQAARHQPEEAPPISVEDYLQFFDSDWCETWFVEFLIEGRLAAVAVVDIVEDGLSAVYTYFDPAFNQYSPGVLAVLWQIEHARQLQLPYVYLGYWIADCRKMRYKIQYQPIQGLIADRWQPLPKPSSTED